MVEALLLDFYGTVVAEDDHIIVGICEEARKTCATPHAVTADQVGAFWRGVFLQETAGSREHAFRAQRDIAVSSLARTLRHFGSTADPAALCGPQFEFWRQPELCTDTRSFLEGLDLPVCVVSNIDRPDLEAALDHHQLPLTLLVTSEDARCYKPHPAIFQAALGMLGLRGDAVLHIGDSLSADIAGAHALGIPAVWINRSSRPRPAPLTAVAEVRTLVEVMPLLGRQRG
ncbi:HAD family hydrolase [Parafrankia elaeagni]|uniref:HAD family hydrolase n=1 Tax=Parafrankia elaeagni TaxID=222534 RepID=UPI000368D6F5|nr:HAD family hydrolase [Parafrankia elaeagni]